MRVTKELAAKVKTSVYAKFQPQLEACRQEKDKAKAQYLRDRRNRRIELVHQLMDAKFSDESIELLLSLIREGAGRHSKLDEVADFSDLLVWAENSELNPDKLYDSYCTTPEFEAASDKADQLTVARTNTLQDVLIALEYTNKRDGIIDVMKEFGLDFTCGQQSTK